MIFSQCMVLHVCPVCVCLAEFRSRPGAAVRQFGLIDSLDNVIIDNCVSCETDLPPSIIMANNAQVRSSGG